MDVLTWRWLAIFRNQPMPATSPSSSRAIARLLVVDDDPDFRGMLARNLTADGFEVAEAATGAGVAGIIASRPPDLILLDVNLANEDGFEVLASIRRTNEIPVILLTARDRESDRVLGLRLGADDYVVKPFSVAELSARVGSVLRRSTRAPQVKTVLVYGDLSIDALSREISVAGIVIETTPKEFDLLHFLASSPRQVFTREQLLSQVWGSSKEWQNPGTVTEHIRRIRRKLEADGEERWIKTIHGVGYRFEP